MLVRPRMEQDVNRISRSYVSVQKDITNFKNHVKCIER